MTPERTPQGKVTLYRVTDGQRFVRWPVDAAAMLATGAYTTDPPTPASADPVPVGSGDDARPVAEAAPDAPAAPPVRVETIPEQQGGTPRRRRA